MRYIYLEIYSNKVLWNFQKDKNPDAYESLSINITIHSKLTKRESIALASELLSRENTEWFVSGGERWTLDLEKLKRSFDVCSDLEWLNGKITVEPEYELQEYKLPEYCIDQYGHGLNYWSRLIITLMPEDTSKKLYQETVLQNPTELLPSLSKFQAGYTDSRKTGFIIMQFDNTEAHNKILNTIKSALQRFSLIGLRADDKEYSDELLTNIRTYMHGCGFGIAVFERLLKDDFNPNISLEVGYMMAQGKPVLFLKDKTLKSLPTDIVGKLYKTFDTQNPEGTIPDKLENWLRDKGLI